MTTTAWLCGIVLGIILGSGIGAELFHRAAQTSRCAVIRFLELVRAAIADQESIVSIGNYVRDYIQGPI